MSCQYTVNRELEKQIYHQTEVICKSQFLQATKWPEEIAYEITSQPVILDTFL